MIIARQDLNQWRAFCARLATALCTLETALETNETARAREVASAALGATLRLGMKLELAGADPPGFECEPRSLRQGPPCAAERWYALMLRDAWDAARALDAVRGNGMCQTPEQEGENARLLRLLLKEVEADLYAEPRARFGE